MRFSINIEPVYFRSKCPQSLALATALEQMRYLAHAVDVCGGHGPTAAKALGFCRYRWSQYIAFTARRIRKYGGEPSYLPRFRRKPRQIDMTDYAKLRPLAEHMHAWEARYIAGALRAAGGVKADASELLGLSRETLCRIMVRRHPLLVDPSKPNRRVKREDTATLWTALWTLWRLMTACAMLGVTLPLPTAAPALAKPNVVREEEQ